MSVEKPLVAENIHVTKYNTNWGRISLLNCKMENPGLDL